MRGSVWLGLAAILLAGACDVGTTPTAPEAPVLRPRAMYGGTVLTSTSFDSTWPFAVGLEVSTGSFGSFGWPICTGSVIGARWVITAGHCVQDAQGYVNVGWTVQVAYGTPDLRPGGPARYAPVESLFVDPAFTQPGTPDIGLVQLASDADVAPAVLGTTDPAVGAVVRIAGFGVHDAAYDDDLQLRAGVFTVEESYAWGFLATSDSAMTCPGDSGGPTLDASGALVAVTSFGLATDCGSSPFAGQASVVHELPWIEQVTRDKQAPLVVDLNADPVAAGATATVTATIDDSNTGASVITTATLTASTLALTMPMQAADGAFDSDVEQVAGSFAAPAASGLVPLCVTGADAAGNTSTPQCLDLPVYDASAGFVTGGGWIDSPAGAYVADPTLKGKATFGFVSRYAPGAGSPSGNAQFRFEAGNLDFQSTSYQWLVVAGARAQFKGTGRINGAGDFGFMITAVDGEVAGGGGTDRLRVKIWDDPTGNVFYDNQMDGLDGADPTTVIRGGDIIVHG